MNTVEIVSLVVGSGIALRVIDHFLTRKLTAKSVSKSHIENIDAATETWQKVVDKLEARIDKLLAQMKEIRDENIGLKEEVYQLREELASFKQLQRKTERYEKQIKKLEEKVAHYERILADNGIAF